MVRNTFVAFGVTILAGGGCYRLNDDVIAGDPSAIYPYDGGPGSQRADGGTVVANTGYCASDAQCGGGLVCDHTSGACSVATRGCGEASFIPNHSDAEVLLVLDRSSSMQDVTSTGTKWSDITGALNKVLTDTAAKLPWGLEMFPATDNIDCELGDVNVAPANMSTNAILSQMAAAQPTGPGTPTAGAMLAAGQYLKSQSGSTRKYILLATDGEPNCGASVDDPNTSDAPAAIAAVKQVAQAGVSTFVVGVSIGAASDATLTQMAQAGGEARQGTTAYFPTSNATDLETALSTVARQIAVCTFDLNPAPPVGDTVDLTIGDKSFARNSSHSGNGWDFTNGGKSIALYGAACDAVQAGGAIAATYVCGSGTTCDGSSHQCVAVPAGLDGGTGCSPLP